MHWIKAEIHEFILRNWRIVKIATTKAQRKLFFNLRGAKKHLGWLSNDEALAIADDLNVKVDEVRQMEGRLSSNDIGFDAPANENDEEPVYAPSHYLESGEIDPAQDNEDTQWQRRQMEKLNAAMGTLDEKSQHILKARWLDEDNKATLQQLASAYGVSAERIRQIEKAAMQKLKAAIAA